MAEPPIQILEVRGDLAGRPTTVTAAVSADAAQAISIALSEQTDRRRAQPMMTADEVLELRRHAELNDRFEPLASARAHAVISLTDQELRDCLLEVEEYCRRVDGEHYQPPELRERLRVSAAVIDVLWDANASVAEIADAAAGAPS
jgi:hypothetical protein